jgi:hypothetical protein
MNQQFVMAVIDISTARGKQGDKNDTGRSQETTCV